MRFALLGQAFRPTKPIDERTLFAGRQSQLLSISEAIETDGQHAIIYGERGVGKTSMANVAMAIASTAPETRTLSAKVTSHNDDTFDSVWRRIFKQIPLRDIALGLTTDDQVEMTYADQATSSIMPDEVHEILKSASRRRSLFIVVDEFDQIDDAIEQKRFRAP
jgi:Cdc6-like AAA superfamily ATPase